MSYAATGVRVLLAAIVLVVLGGGVMSLIHLTDTALSIKERLSLMPWWLAIPIASFLLVVTVGVIWLLVRILFPSAKPRASARLLTVDAVRARAEKLALSERAGESPAPSISHEVGLELGLLEQRSHQQLIYVALFGEVNAGKSSLIKTLVSEELHIDVIAGSTNSIDLYPLPFAGDAEQTIILADVPGTNEVRAHHLANLAREEALRAHVVGLVISGDLSRSAASEWQWLMQFDKPMWLILNKIDLYTAQERRQLVQRLKTRLNVEVITVQALHQQEVSVIDSQGQTSRRSRVVPGDISALTAQLQALASSERTTLEHARQRAVLASLDLKLEQSEHQQRRQVGEKLIRQFTKRAMLGAVAAVAPGSDVVIQSALALGLMHQLCSLYGLSISQIELDKLMQGIGSKLKGSIALVIAIIGNGLKAFPGLGTLSGGALHAIAYGLIFDRLGHALQESLEQTHRSSRQSLNQDDLLQRLDASFAEPSRLLRQARELAELLKSEKQV